MQNEMIGALQQLKTMGVQVALFGFTVPLEDAAGLLFKNGKNRIH